MNKSYGPETCFLWFLGLGGVCLSLPRLRDFKIRRCGTWTFRQYKTLKESFTNSEWKLTRNELAKTFVLLVCVCATTTRSSYTQCENFRSLHGTHFAFSFVVYSVNGLWGEYFAPILTCKIFCTRYLRDVDPRKRDSHGHTPPRCLVHKKQVFGS